METQSIYTLSDLSALNDFLHDQVIDVDSIVFDSDSNSLLITVEKERRDQLRAKWYNFLFGRWRVPVEEVRMHIMNVTNYRVCDNAKVGRYSMSNIEYCQSDKVLRIHACPQLTIEVFGSQLAIDVRGTGRSLAPHKIWMVLGIECSRVGRCSDG